MSYFYFAATLPMVFQGQPPALSLDAFCEACREHLSEEAARAAVELATEGLSQAPLAFPSAWRNAEFQLRNAVARIRASRRGVDAASRLRAIGTFDVSVEQGITDAFGKSTPMERERAIDAIRWQKAEELAGHEAFSLEAIFAYALKLRIAHRWAELNEETGASMAHKLVEQESNSEGPRV